jgi:adenylylsulfate kinase
MKRARLRAGIKSGTAARQADVSPGTLTKYEKAENPWPVPIVYVLSEFYGLSKEDRDTNIHRIGFVARVLARHGVGVITAAISPYAQTRAEVRALADKERIPFIEVHAHAELDALVQRDVKGLYKKALAGEVKHFTGVSDPYEAPAKADVVVRTDLETVAESGERILTVLRGRGLIRAAPKGNGRTEQSSGGAVGGAL